MLASDRRLDVKLLKYELHNALQRKGRGKWITYWKTLQQYLLAQLSSQELAAQLAILLSPSDGKRLDSTKALPYILVYLHNAFVAAILHNAHTKRIPRAMLEQPTSSPTESSPTASANTDLETAVNNDSVSQKPITTLPDLEPVPPAAASEIITIDTSIESVLGKRKVVVPVKNTDIATTSPPPLPTDSKSPSKSTSSSVYKSLLQVKSDKEAIRRLLEMARSKAVRSRCKHAETHTSGLSALLSKYSSKRTQLAKVKKEFQLHSCLYDYQAQALLSTTEEEDDEISLDKPSVGVRPHLSVLNTDPTIEIATCAIEKPSYRVRPRKKVMTQRYAVQEFVPSINSISDILKEASSDEGLQGVSPDAAELMATIVKQQLLDLIASCAEAACDDDLLSFPKYDSKIRHSEACPTDLARMSFRNLTASQAGGLGYSTGPATRPLVWPVTARKKKVKASSNSQKKNTASAAGTTTTGTTKPKKSKSSGSSSKKMPQPTRMIELRHLHEALGNYPEIGGTGVVCFQEKVSHAMSNDYCPYK